MAVFIHELVYASMIGTFLWFILFCLRPITRRVFSQTWHYYVNLIPLIYLFGGARLVTILTSPVYTKIHQLTHTIPVIDSSISVNITFNELPNFTSPLVWLEPAFDQYTNTSVTTNINEKVVENHLVETLRGFNSEIIFGGILIVWLVGAIVFLVWKLNTYRRFRKCILLDNPVFDLSESCPLPVYKNKNVPTPLLVGIFKPIIILPEQEYDENDLKLILKHETTHWRRGDIPVKIILLIANAIHWFNPFTYLINKTAAILCENAVDESLVRNMNNNERVAYGNIILSTLTHAKSQYSSSLVVGFASNGKKELKRKLTSILNFKRMKLPVLVLSIILAISLVFIGGLLVDAREANAERGMVDIGSFILEDTRTLCIYTIRTHGAMSGLGYNNFDEDNEIILLTYRHEKGHAVKVSIIDALDKPDLNDNRYKLYDVEIYGITVEVFEYYNLYVPLDFEMTEEDWELVNSKHYSFNAIGEGRHDYIVSRWLIWEMDGNAYVMELKGRNESPTDKHHSDISAEILLGLAEEIINSR